MQREPWVVPLHFLFDESTTLMTSRCHTPGKFFLIAALAGLQACGGGGSDEGNPPASPAEPLALSLLAGNANDSRGSRDGPGAIASFNGPRGVALDGSGNLYVADFSNHTIRKIDPAGTVTTLAGQARSFGSADGTGAEARFTNPQDIAVDANGTVYVADAGNHTIRRITADGVVSTLAGVAGQKGSTDGPVADARFNSPTGLAVDNAGNLLVVDRLNSTVRMITPGGTVSTLAGKPDTVGSADGNGANARFKFPNDVAVDAQGTIYVSDGDNFTVRRIRNGLVSTLAGRAGQQGSVDGNGANARFERPTGISVDGLGNVYLGDRLGEAVRKIDPAGNVSTLAGTSNAPGAEDGIGAQARFSQPDGIAVDSAGNVFVSDRRNNNIRKISSSAVVTTLAGTVPQSGSTDGIGDQARFSVPDGIAIDASGNALVADRGNEVIRKISPDGQVTTLAGTPDATGNSDGTGNSAAFDSPSDVAVDPAGNTYVADNDNNTIRKISPAGEVTTLAGAPGESGNVDGVGINARFDDPEGIAVDAAGNVYVADTDNNTIRKITPAGLVTTLAGSPDETGSADGTGVNARFDEPDGIAVDAAGNVYVADTDNSTIRKITPQGIVSTLAGQANEEGDADGTGAAARFSFPRDLDIDAQGNLYVLDSGNHTVRKITPLGEVSTVVGDGIPGVLLGTLPGGLGDSLRGIAVSNKALLITSNNGVLRINGLP
jgi:sugar lactone lactonase YvrE